MARSRRPIDPPELPAWRRNQDDEDETPTLSGLEGADPFDSEETQWEAVPPSDSVAARWAAVSPAGFVTESTDPAKGPLNADETLSDPGAPPVLTPQPLGQAKEDPRALAQRLAAEAKARASSSPPSEPREDPRELAMRLAQEAKARIAATPAPAPMALAPAPTPAPLREDPRELAKRLAQEAKAKLAATPAPAPPASAVPEPPPVAEDPRDLARRLAQEAKARIAATPAPAPQAAPTESAAPPAPSHLERKVSRPRSAKEILEEAMRADAAKEVVPSGAMAPAPAPPAPAPPAPAPQPAPPPPSIPAQQPVTAAPAPAPAPAAPAPTPEAAPTDGAAVLLQLLPGAAVEAPTVIHRPEVFQAVWRAHRTRAVHEQDWSGVAAASVLVDAAARLQQGTLRAGAFVACRVGLGGQPYAVFADLDRRCVLAILSPADVYLAGLGDPS